MLQYIGILAFVLASATLAHAEVPITACGQSLENGEIGVLQTDVVCQAATQTGVVVGHGATLRLNGHTLAGGTYGVACLPGCKIEGPGVISGFSQAGVASTNDRHLRVRISDVDIRDNLDFGVLLPWDARLTLTNVTVTNNNHGGVALGPTNSEGNVVGRNVTVSGNHGPGVEAKQIRLKEATIQGNDGSGIYSVNGTARLVDSTLVGNGTNSTPSYDLKTRNAPKLVRSTCGLSARVLADGMLSGTWGVCTGD